MKYYTLIPILIGISLLFATTPSQLPYPIIIKAIAIIYPTKNNDASGVVFLAQQSDGLHITARIKGLTPGNHGFHIHEFGNCACDDAVCAGTHFNPTQKHHGSPHDSECHIGDLGNILADEKGEGTYDHTNKHATLNGPHSIIGRTIIIHAQEDDFKTQPTGNSGSRIGCGVIGIASDDAAFN